MTISHTITLFCNLYKISRFNLYNFTNNYVSILIYGRRSLQTQLSLRYDSKQSHQNAVLYIIRNLLRHIINAKHCISSKRSFVYLTTMLASRRRTPWGESSHNPLHVKKTVSRQSWSGLRVSEVKTTECCLNRRARAKQEASRAEDVHRR